jgi:hypothetical protein
MGWHHAISCMSAGSNSHSFRLQGQLLLSWVHHAHSTQQPTPTPNFSWATATATGTPFQHQLTGSDYDTPYVPPAASGSGPGRQDGQGSQGPQDGQGSQGPQDGHGGTGTGIGADLDGGAGGPASGGEPGSNGNAGGSGNDGGPGNNATDDPSDPSEPGRLALRAFYRADMDRIAALHPRVGTTTSGPLKEAFADYLAVNLTSLAPTSRLLAQKERVLDAQLSLQVVGLVVFRKEPSGFKSKYGTKAERCVKLTHFLDIEGMIDEGLALYPPDMMQLTDGDREQIELARAAASNDHADLAAAEHGLGKGEGALDALDEDDGLSHRDKRIKGLLKNALISKAAQAVVRVRSLDAAEHQAKLAGLNHNSVDEAGNTTPNRGLPIATKALKPAPSRNANTFPVYDPSLPKADISVSDVTTALKRMSKGSAGGASGVTTDCIVLTLLREKSESSKRAISALCAATQATANGYVHDEAKPLMAASWQYMLSKPDNGIRPICCGDAIRRIMSKTMLAVIEHKIRPLFADLQYGVGMPCGADIAFKKTALLYKSLTSDPDGVLILADTTNAFNSVGRDAIYNACVLFVPELANFFAVHYKGTAGAYYKRALPDATIEQGQKAARLSSFDNWTGTQQGEVEATYWPRSTSPWPPSSAHTGGRPSTPTSPTPWSRSTETYRNTPRKAPPNGAATRPCPWLPRRQIRAICATLPAETLRSLSANISVTYLDDVATISCHGLDAAIADDKITRIINLCICT